MCCFHLKSKLLMKALKFNSPGELWEELMRDAIEFMCLVRAKLEGNKQESKLQTSRYLLLGTT